MSRILTLPEAAERLRLSKSTLYHLTSSRSIPFYKVGKVLFREDELDEWMRARKVNPIAHAAIEGTQA